MKTASQTRYEKAAMELAREKFFKHPESLPEAIAKHYVSHAMIALELAHLIKQKKLYPQCASTANQLIDRLVEGIKMDHAHDFGTEIVDVVSRKAKQWNRYIEELDGVE